jgi:phage terminase large subunit GpA-like protein
MISPTNLTAEEIYSAAAAAGARPDPLLAISQWADRYRWLSQRASAEHGRWRTERTPYLREIMDCLSPSSLIERVVFMKGAQIGGTECGNNWMGYVIHQAPGPMMSVQPTVEMAKRNSKQRIEPLIEESEVLRKLVHDPRSRDSGNTILSKDFPGGVLVMTGANSAVGLRSMAARYLFLDEIDAYPGDVEGEGDPITLAMARTRTFARRKVFLVSTPKIAGMSRIETAYEESDQRKYWLPCPACREFQILKFAQLRWPNGDPQSAVYVCEHCGQEIRNHQKQSMLALGQWRAGAKGDCRTAGFHISSLYSPVGWFSWGDAAKQFEQAQKNSALLQVFANTVLGETWTMLGEAPDFERLMSRRDASYRLGQLPPSVVFLTAGVDVQKTWLQGHVWGWARGRQRWIVDRFILEGDPYHQETWDRLTERLNTTYRHRGGADLSIVRMAVDSGYATQEVYRWAKQQGSGRVMVVKGSDSGASLVSTPQQVEVSSVGRKLKYGARVHVVNVSMAKSELYGLLGKERPIDGDPYPPGWVHFASDLDEEFFRQLTAESLVSRVVKGYRKHEWVKTRERNEDLDCCNYARAAASVFGVDRFQEQHWRGLEMRLHVEPAQNALPDSEPEATGPLPVPMQRPPVVQPRPRMQIRLL